MATNIEKYGTQLKYSSDVAENIGEGVILQSAEATLDKEDFEVKDMSGNVVGGYLYNPIITATATVVAVAGTDPEDALKAWVSGTLAPLLGADKGGSTLVTSTKITLATEEAVSYSISIKYKPNAVSVSPGA